MIRRSNSVGRLRFAYATPFPPYGPDSVGTHRFAHATGDSAGALHFAPATSGNDSYR